MTFGERLDSYISRAGITQKQLAEQLGITPTRLNYWVKDKREPDIENIKALAQALGVSGDELLGTDDIKNDQTADSDLTETELALVKSYRELDAPGRAVVDAVLESQQQRIREYGPARK